MHILVTGASGFIGNALCPQLLAHGHSLVECVRRAGRPGVRFDSQTAQYVTGDISIHTDWQFPLQGVECVIHLAGLTHDTGRQGKNAIDVYREINAASTVNLAHQAASLGVRRFIFVSSIKVNGDERDLPYSDSDTPMPVGPYAISKWEAEQGLQAIAAETGLEIVVIRPALVYGPGVKANFLHLLRWIERGLPMPFGLVRNRRSFMYLGNLTSLIEHCLVSQAVVGANLLASDGDEVSTPGLIEMIAAEMGRPAFLLPFPPGVMRSVLSLLGKRDQAERLLGSLAIDGRPLVEKYDWRPPHTLKQGIHETVQAYMTQGRSSISHHG